MPVADFLTRRSTRTHAPKSGGLQNHELGPRLPTANRRVARPPFRSHPRVAGRYLEFDRRCTGVRRTRAAGRSHALGIPHGLPVKSDGRRDQPEPAIDRSPRACLEQCFLQADGPLAASERGPDRRRRRTHLESARLGNASRRSTDCPADRRSSNSWARRPDRPAA